MNDDLNPNGAGTPASEPSSDGGGRSLPPPAFPPGARRSAASRSAQTRDLSSAFISPDDPIPDREGGVPDDAFISPDAPIDRAASRHPDDGYISPDEPIPHRAPHSAPVALDEAFDHDDVVVTGMGDDAHLSPDELALGFDPHVLEVVDKVGKLAEALKRKGEAGLRATPDMSRFEATLRSYCVGYLAGRRAEEDGG